MGILQAGTDNKGRSSCGDLPLLFIAGPEEVVGTAALHIDSLVMPLLLQALSVPAAGMEGMWGQEVQECKEWLVWLGSTGLQHYVMTEPGQHLPAIAGRCRGLISVLGLYGRCSWLGLVRVVLALLIALESLLKALTGKTLLLEE